MKAALPLLAALLLATPAIAQDERVWSLVESERSVMLIYGTPDSDDLLAGVTCRRGSNEASVHLTVEHTIGFFKTDNEIWMDRRGEAEPWEVKIVIAGMRVEASALPDEMNGGSILRVDTPTDGPLLAAIGNSGRLRAKAFREVVDPPPFRQADFDRFIQLCKVRGPEGS
ncbi:MAG: hypothetical protein EON95_02805 [Caulobacteraceae bacterium]|nr:MAG: hypothetical protein EON95_02805 [Caulobacteraceae bacterium]